VVERVRPYLRRHVFAHNLYRLLARLPRRRVPFRMAVTVPTLEPPSATLEGERAIQLPLSPSVDGSRSGSSSGADLAAGANQDRLLPPQRGRHRGRI
jgi:hypothetical protein